MQGCVGRQRDQFFIQGDLHKLSSKNKKRPQHAARFPVQLMPLSYAGIIRIRFKGSPCHPQGSQCDTPLGLMFHGADSNYQQDLSQVNIFQGFTYSLKLYSFQLEILSSSSSITASITALPIVSSPRPKHSSMAREAAWLIMRGVPVEYA